MAIEIHIVYHMNASGQPVHHWAFVTSAQADEYVAKKKGHIPHELFIGRAML